jgi:hypothetical protein
MPLGVMIHDVVHPLHVSFRFVEMNPILPLPVIILTNMHTDQEIPHGPSFRN